MPVNASKEFGSVRPNRTFASGQDLAYKDADNLGHDALPLKREANFVIEVAKCAKDSETWLDVVNRGLCWVFASCWFRFSRTAWNPE